VTLMAERKGALAIGITLAAMSTASGALFPIITRYGAMNIDPLLFCAGSAIVGATCALPWLGTGLRVLFDRRYRMRLAAISLAGTFVPSLFMVYGLRHVNAVTGVLLLQTEPIYSLIVAMLVVGEVPAQRQMIATGLILAGIFSAFWGAGGLNLALPELMVALTPLMWQLSHVITLRVMPPLRPVTVTAARNCHASILLAALVIGTNPSALRELGQFYVVGTLIVSGTVVYFLGTLTWYGAISRLSLSWTTAVVVPGVPVLTVVFAAVFLGEPGYANWSRLRSPWRVFSVWCWAAIRRVLARRKLRR
jgi:drug/metabolite transporter (DMT)-like permease